jgi:peptide alpha-N-acetyltransferase
MVVVSQRFRGRRLGTTLVRHAIEQMALDGASEVSLEAEATNIAALTLYNRLGFIRDKRLEKCAPLPP